MRSLHHKTFKEDSEGCSWSYDRPSRFAPAVRNVCLRYVGNTVDVITNAERIEGAFDRVRGKIELVIGEGINARRFEASGDPTDCAHIRNFTQRGAETVLFIVATKQWGVLGLHDPVEAFEVFFRDREALKENPR